MHSTPANESSAGGDNGPPSPPQSCRDLRGGGRWSLQEALKDLQDHSFALALSKARLLCPEQEPDECEQMERRNAAHALDYQLDAPKKVKDKLVHASALM